MHENCKQTEAKLIRYYFREKVQCQLHLSEMPGENCAIAGCSISREDNVIRIFKASLANKEFGKKRSHKVLPQVKCFVAC